MTEPADDPRLLAVAGAVADGTDINWDDVQKPSTMEESAVLDALRAVSRLNSAKDDAPTAWGPFAVVGPIGRGMFGRVYHAVDANLRRDVALKVITASPGGRRVDLDAALDEGRLLARINHPNVVKVYRADRLDNEVGIAMELVKGTTLHGILEQQGSLSPREAALIGIDLCRALAALHAAGALHGDIKPRNVMREPGGRTVLMDLGAGRDLAVEPGLGEDFAGTPIYLAPEVFAGHSRTRASDIYSLGVLLYHLVTRSYPVEGPTTTSIERQHGLPGSRRRLRDVRPDLPEPFVQAVERAISERAEERFETAGAFEAALTTALGPLRPIGVRQKMFVFAAAAVILAVAGVALTYRALYPGQPRLEVAAAGVAANVAPAPTYRIEAAIYAEREGIDSRLQRGAKVTPGDRLSLQVETSVPVHLYVVNEDERGESFLLFPLPGQSVTNPLSPGRRHRLPAASGDQRLSWQVTTAGGREHFLIFANPEPSPEFEEMFASLPPPTLNQPSAAVPLSREALGILRGVGGLAQTAQGPLTGQLRLARDFATPLVDGEETVQGVWIRQVTLENPAP